MVIGHRRRRIKGKEQLRNEKRERREWRHKGMEYWYLRGFSLEDVGDMFDVSRQRVHQILKDRGIDTTRNRPTKILPRSAVREEDPNSGIDRVMLPE